MATYKVPQDVEADDKLIGPFSFRQFIYLIIVAGSGAAAWALSQIFIGLALIPLPFILFFGALALPLRKDQPMETYLAAIVSFYLKPRKRLWEPDGEQALIQIVAPKRDDGPQLKDFSTDEAEKRLSYLANVVDSRGWAVRGVQAPVANSMNPAMYNEAQQTTDILDESSRTTMAIDNRLDQAAAQYHQQLVSRMAQPQQFSQPIQQPLPQQQIQPQSQTQSTNPQLTYNPYPAFQQHVVQPMSAQKQGQPIPQKPVANNTTQTPSNAQPSADIINLANNPDLSIETIAHEANRIKQKESLPKDEVVISLH